MLIDSHAHLNFPQLANQIDQVLDRAEMAGVKKIICVGTQVKDSQQAIDLAQDYRQCYATVGLHPHDAQHQSGDIDKIAQLVNKPKVVAVGECGLDYYHQRASKAEQFRLLEQQLELAQEHGKPLVFHVREAFKDFFSVVDKYNGLRAVVHSFSSNEEDLEAVLSRGFYVALNGIVTFTKDPRQLAAAKAVPLEKLILETDAPFLTPTPYRGQINEPAHVKIIAEFLANLRSEPIAEIAEKTTENAKLLFNL